MGLVLQNLFDGSAGKVGADDRPHYNNLLALQCQVPYALDRDLTADTYVERFVRNWNFSTQFDFLKTDQFSHEFSHILLEMALISMQRNPFPFEYGYNGNAQAEATVLAMEAVLHNPELIGFMDGYAFVEKFENYYTSFEVASDWLNEQRATQDVSAGLAKTVFEARRARCFDNEPLDVIEAHSHQEIYIDRIAAHDIATIWDKVQPFFNQVEMMWHKTSTERQYDEAWKTTLNAWLRPIKIRDIDDCLKKKDDQKPPFQLSKLLP